MTRKNSCIGTMYPMKEHPEDNPQCPNYQKNLTTNPYIERGRFVRGAENQEEKQTCLKKRKDMLSHTILYALVTDSNTNTLPLLNKWLQKYHKFKKNILNSKSHLINMYYLLCKQSLQEHFYILLLKRIESSLVLAQMSLSFHM